MTKHIEKSEKNTKMHCCWTGIIAGGLLVSGTFLAYSKGVRYGYSKGVRYGRSKILTKIMYASKNGGALAMKHPDYGHYMFKAIKEAD